jgi:solute carrier family 35 protein C2
VATDFPLLSCRFNKWLLGSFAGGTFRFPFSTTVVHLVMKYALSAACLGMPCFRRGGCGLGSTRPDILYLIVPIGVATALDICLSNFSLLSVTLTLYTIGVVKL